MPPDNLELNEKATNKLKEINYAYTRLKSVAKASNNRPNKSTQQEPTSSHRNSRFRTEPRSSATKYQKLGQFNDLG